MKDQMNAIRSPIQKILVPLDLSPFAKTATETACAIAEKHQAVVEGLVVLDLPEIIGLDLPFHAWMRPEALELSQQRTIDAKQRITDALKKFSETCEQKEVAHIEAQAQGVPADCLLDAASFHDLVVLGLQTFFHFQTSDEKGDSLEKVLRAPTAPVLALPQTDQAEWQKVLIVFDGSPNASRALKEFARFAQPYDFAITILNSNEDQEQGHDCVNSAESYLRSHGLTNIQNIVTDRDIRDVIEQDCIGNYDLIVAGIHSRRFVLDAFIGSLTRMLIKDGSTPLFLV
jgi:nucleotide-binding universal stress UspA family protein